MDPSVVLIWRWCPFRNFKRFFLLQSTTPRVSREEGGGEEAERRLSGRQEKLERQASLMSRHFPQATSEVLHRMQMVQAAMRQLRANNRAAGDSASSADEQGEAAEWSLTLRQIEFYSSKRLSGFFARPSGRGEKQY